MTNTQTHYFASCGYGWATADTRAEAIEKMIRGNVLTSEVKRNTLAAHKQGNPGFYIWSCKVLAPSDANYQIEWFMPKGVEIEKARHHDVTYITAKELAYTTRKEDIK